MHKDYACVQIKADNSVELIEFDSPYLTLDDLYKYAECDTIQIVRAGPTDLMCIDDNGKLFNKPINNIATILYGAMPYDFIVGTALLGTSTPPRECDEPDMFAMPYEVAHEEWLFLNSAIEKGSSKK